MKNIRLLCSLILLAGISGTGTALADRGHFHGHSHSNIGLGFYFGAPYPPFYSPYYYPYPAYPPVVVVPAQPQQYIERDPPPSESQALSLQDGNYWYHCDDPEGYYPYIKECPGGWKTVVPSPPQK